MSQRQTLAEVLSTPDPETVRQLLAIFGTARPAAIERPTADSQSA